MVKKETEFNRIKYRPGLYHPSPPPSQSPQAGSLPCRFGVRVDIAR